MLSFHFNEKLNIGNLLSQSINHLSKYLKNRIKKTPKEKSARSLKIKIYYNLDECL